MAKKIFLSFIILLTGSIAYSQKTYDQKLGTLYKHTVPQIKSEEVEEKLKADQNIILLDTRSPEEYEVSHLPGALFIDYDKFKTSDVQKIDPNAEVVVYCTIGYRSERIGEKLQDLGFTNVKNLYGGIFEWVNEDGKLLNKHNQPTDSVHIYSKKWGEWLQHGIKVY